MIYLNLKPFKYFRQSFLLSQRRQKYRRAQRTKAKTSRKKVSLRKASCLHTL